ncbi:MAG: hypothetical protein HY698_10880 [Deltaproteobacteria bacterium]|nr:hypothetical protein [Deltaproteobacteria bacterium]
MSRIGAIVLQMVLLLAGCHARENHRGVPDSSVYYSRADAAPAADAMPPAIVPAASIDARWKDPFSETPHDCTRGSMLEPTVLGTAPLEPGTLEQPFVIALLGNDVYWSTQDPYSRLWCILKASKVGVGSSEVACGLWGVFDIYVDDGGIYWTSEGRIHVMRQGESAHSMTFEAIREVRSLVSDGEHLYFEDGAEYLYALPKQARSGEQPRPIGSKWQHCDQLTVDDEYVYCTSGREHAILRVSKQGGQWETIVTGQDDPRSPVIRDGRIFWASRGFDGHAAIKSAPRAGAKPEILASNLGDNVSFAAYEGNVYWTSDGALEAPGLLGRLILSDETVEKVIQLPKHPYGLAIHHGSFFWVDHGVDDPYSGRLDPYVPGGVWTWNGTGEPALLVDEQVEPLRIAVDDDALYWVNNGNFLGDDRNGSIWKLSLGDGSTSVIAEHLFSPAVLAEDDENLFWVSPGTINTIPKRGGEASVLVRAYHIRGMAVDEGQLYWGETLDDDGHGAVMKMDLTTKSISVLSTNQALPGWLAVDREHVYWANVSVAGEHQRRVMRANKYSGATELVAEGFNWLTGLLAHDGWVYWHDFQSFRVFRGNPSVSAPTVIAYDPEGPSSLTLDDKFAYWTTPKSIKKRALTGGPITALGQYSAEKILVDDRSLYWVADGKLLCAAKE